MGIIPNGKAITDIEKLLTQCKLFVALYSETDANGKTITGFITKAESAILARVDFIDAETDLTSHQAMLRKLVRRGVRKPRTKLFTTNYDLAFEYAARLQRFVVIDGFSHAALPVFDRSHFELDIVRRDAKDAPDYLDSVVQLYKLHGSIGWRRTTTEIIRSRGDEGKPVLIYPRDSKYQEAFEPPYLDMMSAFQSALREPDTTLLVAGFSFNDSHLAQPVLAALESNMSFRLVVCDPVFLDSKLIEKDPVTVGSDAAKNSFHQQLIRLIQAGDERVMLLNGRFADLTLAVPDLVAETERERHALRVKALRDATGSAGAKS
nr:SIR2 family protein [Nitrobacter winogradskyi]